MINVIPVTLRTHITFEIYVFITASDGLYHGPTHLLGPYATGHVRARMWIAIDMPPAIFTREVNISSEYLKPLHDV